jgi:chromosome segregation ATPase
MSEEQQQKTYAEGSPWFWRLFGGAIFGIIPILLVTILNYFGSAIESLRAENLQQKTAIAELKEKVITFDKEIHRLQASIKNADSIKEKVGIIDTVKEHLSSLEKDVKEVTKVLQDSRERLLVLESKKADHSKPTDKPSSTNP